MKIAFIADIHSNLEALEAVLAKIDSLKIKQIYCLGDLCGYGADPNAVIEIIRKRKIPCIIGNHEWAILNQTTEGLNPIAAVSIWWHVDKMKRENLEFLRKLEDRYVLRIKNQRVLLVHGSPSNPIEEYVYEQDINEKFLKDYGAVVMGHTHIPFVKEVGSKLAINCGAVGQPRDENSKASFAVIDDENFTAEIIRVEYDINTAAEKIIKAGLPEFLAQRLFLGI